MGGGGGVPEAKDPSGIGSSRAGLEAAAGAEPSKMLDQLPGWAAGDTMESWLTRMPGSVAGTPPDKAADTPAPAAMAPEASTTLGTLGAADASSGGYSRPPVYGAGTGNRTEADERAGRFAGMQGPGIAGAAPVPAGPATQPDDWVSVGLPAGFNADASNLYAAQQQPGAYNYNGVYTPRNLSQSNVMQYSPGQGPQQPNAMAPGTTLAGADVENQPRMRRQLYDFNMNAYGNPYGPQSNAGTPWWQGPPSFLTGGSGG